MDDQQDTSYALKEAVPTLPSSWYVEPSHHLIEQERIWLAGWVYLCHHSALAKPREFRTLCLGDQPMVVVRDETGKLRGYYNTCRHRGSTLCLSESGRLEANVLVCPYHQWSYRLSDGQLAATTSFTEAEGFQKSHYPLFPIAVREWRGAIFINPDPDAEWDTDTLFQRSSDGLARFPLEEMKVAKTWSKIINCNWKLFWENFNECLHCPNIHPELSSLVPLYSRRIMSRMDMPGWEDHDGSDDPLYRGGLRDGAETWSQDGSAQGHIISSLSDEELKRGHLYASAWPSMFIAGYADHMRIVRVLPKGPTRTEITAEWLFEDAALNDPDYDIANVVDFATLVMEQDGDACEMNQKGLDARPFTEGVLMPEEFLLKDFHDWVRDLINTPKAS